MAKEFAKRFYQSKAWKDCRRSYIADRQLIDGGMCETCHAEPIYIVHHKVTLTQLNINNPEITLNHKHLKGDCKKCHDDEDGHFNKVRPRTELKCAFDEHGQPYVKN